MKTYLVSFEDHAEDLQVEVIWQPVVPVLFPIQVLLFYVVKNKRENYNNLNQSK